MIEEPNGGNGYDALKMPAAPTSSTFKKPVMWRHIQEMSHVEVTPETVAHVNLRIDNRV